MVVGIVAEYNPFHNGHKYQIDYAKNTLGASQVVIAMSGSFTQRGEIACFNKYTRAEAALTCDADIVFEIPTIFATSSAREYASAAIALLSNTKVVDTILFGAECSDKELFIDSAKKLIDIEESDEFNELIKYHMSTGKSYALARSEALSKYIPTDILSSPNNILGLEYCRYIILNNLDINIEVLKRSGNDYNSTELSKDISSASAIRRHMASHRELLSVPEKALSIYNNATYIEADDISSMLHYKLFTDTDLTRYLDCNDELAARITNNLDSYVNFTQFCDLIKTKNITYSKVSRVLCHILLDITEDDFCIAKENGYIKKLRMLGFSRNGSSLLSDIKNKSSYNICTSPDQEIDHFDILSSDLLRAIETSKTQKPQPTEFTRKFNLTNI
ncbi:MAG: nucleotidyltransferase family protein [Pseudobutyrivibrio sp.]|nr:nucleotidyltransferase family protein [Pseudobutyrivibrio sp.]